MSNVPLEEEAKIGTAFQDYFLKLFTTSVPSREDIDRSTHAIRPIVTDEMNWQLSQKFTKEEVYFDANNCSEVSRPGQIQCKILSNTLEYRGGGDYFHCSANSKWR